MPQWIYCLFRESTSNPHFSPNHYAFTFSYAKSLYSTQLSFARINFLFHDFTGNSVSFSRNHYEYTILDPKSIWIHYLRREFPICFVILLWIHYLCRDFTMHTLSASQFYYEFTIWFPKSLWINYPRPEINLYSISFSWMSSGFTICFANSPWNHYFFVISIWIFYLLREFTRNSSSFSRIH